jgi:hypothetical protein
VEEKKHEMYRANLPQDRRLVRCSCGYNKASTQTFEEIEAEHQDEINLVPTN